MKAQQEATDAHAIFHARLDCEKHSAERMPADGLLPSGPSGGHKVAVGSGIAFAGSTLKAAVVPYGCLRNK